MQNTNQYQWWKELSTNRKTKLFNKYFPDFCADPKNNEFDVDFASDGAIKQMYDSELLGKTEYMMWWDALIMRKKWDLFYKYNPMIAESPAVIELDISRIYPQHIKQIWKAETQETDNEKHCKQKIQEIRNAYTRIRTIDTTIPDDVLDFMKNAAIGKLEVFNILGIPGIFDAPVKEQTLQPKTIPYQCCPKCNGQGTVSKPPYIAGDVYEWSSSSAVFPCDVCNGAKIIPMYVITQINTENESN